MAGLGLLPLFCLQTQQQSHRNLHIGFLKYSYMPAHRVDFTSSRARKQNLDASFGAKCDNGMPETTVSKNSIPIYQLQRIKEETNTFFANLSKSQSSFLLYLVIKTSILKKIRCLLFKYQYYI